MLRDASAKDDCRKELLMDIPTTDFVRAGSLEELKAKGRLVVHGPHRPILVVHDKSRVFALDNRCPHMGFRCGQVAVDAEIVPLKHVADRPGDNRFAIFGVRCFKRGYCHVPPPVRGPRYTLLEMANRGQGGLTSQRPTERQQHGAKSFLVWLP